MTAHTDDQGLDAGRAVSELARIVFEDKPLESVLQQVAEVVKRAVPGAEEVSLTLIRGQRPATAAYTGQLALDADELQYGHGYGPCMDAGRGGETMLVRDMRAETRWPDYAAEVVANGVQSSLSVPLPVQDEFIGAVNIYATSPDAFDAEAVALAETLAAYAGVAVRNAHAYASAADLAEQLQEAMRTRAVIEQAKGILMGERRCSADEAFDLLVRLSQHSNRKVREVAAALVAKALEGRG